MNSLIRNLVLILISALFISSCCSTRYEEYKTQVYTPVYKKLDDIRSGIKNLPARDLVNPGKIYVFGKFLFICEKGEGIHIFDNSNPASPQNLSFITIPGNGDIAVRNNTLYADSYIDLVALDISNPANATEVKRVEGIFPNFLDLNGEYNDPELGIITKWDVKDTVISYTYKTCDEGNLMYPVYKYNRNGSVDVVDRSMSDVAGGGGNGTSGSGATGKGGSMARFTIYNNYLYSVDRNNLQLFDISSPANPKPWSKINIGWNIETIFPFRDKLFIGSMTGMFIYDNSNPVSPSFICEFRHARGCDPVVANENYAYITLRSGTFCNNNMNELLVVDIKDLKNPKLIRQYPMQGPYGVGIDGTTLFVCDGLAGLKVYNSSKPEDIKLINWKNDFNTYDIIPMGDFAIIIGKDGLYQYDYTDPANLKFLSKIPVKK